MRFFSVTLDSPTEQMFVEPGTILGNGEDSRTPQKRQNYSPHGPYILGQVHRQWKNNQNNFQIMICPGRKKIKIIWKGKWFILVWSPLMRTFFGSGGQGRSFWEGEFWIGTWLKGRSLPCKVRRKNIPSRGNNSYKCPEGGEGWPLPGTARRTMARRTMWLDQGLEGSEEGSTVEKEGETGRGLTARNLE